MASHKIERTTEDIRRELTAIFRELKDPRVTGAFLSIVRVEVTNDLSYCTVHVSAIEGLDRAKEAVKRFTATDSIEYSAHISRVLNSLDISESEDGEDE